MMNRARAALVVAACVVALTGCVKVDADLKVHSNETVSGNMTIGLDKKLLPQGQSLDTVRKSIEDQIKKTTTDGVKCDAYEDDKFIGTECSLEDVPFNKLSGSSFGGVKFEKSGDRFVVTTSSSNNTNIPSGSQPEVNFKITMPGKIVEKDAGAQVDGRTATYTDATKLNSIRLVSEAGGGFPLWAIILVAVLLLLLIGAVVFFVLRGRKSGAQQPYGQQPYPGQYGQPGQQGWGQQPGQQYPPPGQPGQQYPPPGQPGQQPYGGQPGQQYGGQPGQQPQQGWGPQQPGQQQYPPQQGQPGQQGWGQQPGQQPGQPGWGQQPGQQYPPQQGQQGWGQDPGDEQR